jgi:hypothetical protein
MLFGSSLLDIRVLPAPSDQLSLKTSSAESPVLLPFVSVTVVKTFD